VAENLFAKEMAGEIADIKKIYHGKPIGGVSSPAAKISRTQFICMRIPNCGSSFDIRGV